MATLCYNIKEKVATNYFCEPCHYTTSRKNNYTKHLLTASHHNVTKCYQNQQKISKKLAHKYFCEICNYTTSQKSNLTNHFLTLKHSKAINLANLANVTNNPYTCDKCLQPFNNRMGLWRHKKKCIITDKQELHDYKELILSVIKDNQEMKEIMLEVVKNSNVTNNNISNCNNNTTHNKSFNLQFFLNETCKDAMNIMDFVNSVNLQLDDLEEVGEVGFVSGISNIIIKNLKTLDVTQRPLHCSDAKREVLYVKDENKWEKEPDNKPKVRKAIKHIACKNSKLLTTFQQVYPQSKDSDSKYNDKFNHLVIEAFGGSGNEDEENEDKIIRNLTKEVVIDKD